MKITVKVKTGAKKEEVERVGDGVLKVRVVAQPEKGRANEAVVGALSKFFGVAKSRIKIVRGLSSKTKLVELV